MRTGIYARVSTDKQAEKYGISSQIEALKKKCIERGWSSISDEGREAFVDDGYSGSELDRPALNRLRKAVEEGRIDIVFSYDPDRLSRNLSDLLLLDGEFTKQGIKLDFVTQEMDSSPEGRMFFAIRGAVAQYEREKIRERCVRGMREKARQGKVLGGSCAPFGYTYDKEKSTLVEDPEHAAIIKMIFRIYATENLSIMALASRLNSFNLPTPGGGEKWRSSTLGRMLRNETYAGKLYEFRNYRVEPKIRRKAFDKHKKSSTAIRPREEWVSVSVPAIVPMDLFEAVQKKLSRNLELARRNTKNEYLLSGVLHCSFCGGRMGGHVMHGVRYYGCYQKYKSEKTHHTPDGKPILCRCPEIKADIIESQVWDEICGLIRDPDTLLNALHNRNENNSDTKEANERELQLCETRLKSIPVEQKRLVEGYRKGLYPDFMMREEMGRTNREQKELEARKIELEKQLTRGIITANQEEAIKSFVIRINDGLDNVDFIQKQTIVRELTEKLIYDGESVEIQTIINPNVQLHPLTRGLR